MFLLLLFYYFIDEDEINDESDELNINYGNDKTLDESIEFFP